jgi:parallel beta-helix repeat protein
MSARRATVLTSTLALLLALGAPAAQALNQPTATTSVTVSTLDDSGTGSLRAALASASPDDTTQVLFAVNGTITLASALPAITTTVVLDGTSAPGYTAGGAPTIGINFAGATGIRIDEGADGSQVLGLALGNAAGDGITVAAPSVTIADNYVGITISGAAAPNGGHGIHLVAGSDRSHVGTNPTNSSAWASNVISHNAGSGLVIENSSGNIVVANRIGTNPAGTAAAPNGAHGIAVSGASANNTLGGTVSVDGVTGAVNNPTGNKGQVTPTFTRPPLGNVVSGNTEAGIAIIGATNNTISGNFVGTSASGNADLGNGTQGILLDGANRTQIVGCTLVDEPFIYYNVVSGNGASGIEVRNSDNVVVQGNFTGVAADNATTIGNDRHGLLVTGTSAKTQAGGVIPLGNVTSGNGRNGISVTGKATGFVSFNNFAGLVAFGGASPNGLHGIYVTSTAGDNLIRTSVTSGNLGDGIRLAGKATGVTIDPVISGLSTSGSGSLPNGGNGLTITGNAHRNVVGGTRKSVMPHTVFSSNDGFGIRIEGNANHNLVYDTYVGVSITGKTAVGNGAGGISIAEQAHHNIIGGKKSTARRSNVIAGNTGNGITLAAGTRTNTVVNNYIGASRLKMVFPNTGRNIVNRGKANVIKNNILAP